MASCSLVDVGNQEKHVEIGSVLQTCTELLNQQWIISIDKAVTGGGFTTRIGDATLNQTYYDVETPRGYDDRQYNVPLNTTGGGLVELHMTNNAGSLDTSLSGAPRLGTSWPNAGGPVGVAWQTGAVTSEVQYFDFRGAVSTTERPGIIKRVRDLACACARAYLEHQEGATALAGATGKGGAK